MITTPTIEPHPDGFKATWPGFPRAFALFSVERDRVIISDIFRDPAQPKGTAGAMLASALRQAGARRPQLIRIAKILESQITLAQIRARSPLPETVLGKTLANCVAALGGNITQWEQGTERGKSWIQAAIDY